MQLNIALPGFIWQDVGDIEHIYPKAKLSLIRQLLKTATVSQLDFNYSDLLYSTLSQYNNSSLATMLNQQLANSNKYTSYLIAEPTHLQNDRNRLLISDSSILQLNSESAQQIIQKLNHHFKANVEFYFITPELWLMGTNHDLTGITTYPVNDIIGENIDEYLPHGGNAIWLSKIMTEIQMLLWNLPLLNADHEIKLNNIWLWDKNIAPKITTTFEKIFITQSKTAINSSGLLRNNAKISPMPQQLQQALTNNNLIILDSLYYASCYRDSQSFIKKLDELDQYLRILLTATKYSQLNLLMPNKTSTLKFTINLWSKYKLWRKNNLVEIIKSYS